MKIIITIDETLPGQPRVHASNGDGFVTRNGEFVQFNTRGEAYEAVAKLIKLSFDRADALDRAASSMAAFIAADQLV
jgi:hypothetical protein